MSDSHTSGLSGASRPIILIATGPRVYVYLIAKHFLFSVFFAKRVNLLPRWDSAMECATVSEVEAATPAVS